LPELGDGLRQAPIGHTNAHAALNDSGKLDHPWIVSQSVVCQT
jgi:hypothetical protein